MSKESSSSNVVLGTLIGTAIGFGAGLLLAPASGKETRHLLGDKANEAKDAINDAAEKTVASLKEVRQSAEEALKDVTAAKKE